MLRYATIVESKLIVWLLHKSEYKNSHELTALDLHNCSWALYD